MESAPGRLVLKLERMRHEVSTRARDPIRGQALRPQVDTLDALIAEARQVESTAEQLGFGDRFPGTVPGLKPLADRLSTAAKQFGWSDIESYLPTETISVPPEVGEVPLPATAGQVLGLPYAEFLQAVDAKPPAEALPYLREQRQYYAVEAADIERYLSTVRGERTHETATAMLKRKQELLSRIRELDVRIRRLEDQMRPDGRPTLPCFAIGTPVLTPDGPRAIETLTAGDAVLSCDTSADRILTGRVIECHRNLTLRFIRITVAREVVRATGRHPFWVEEESDWVPAEQLIPGLHLRLHGADSVAIDDVKVESVVDAPTFDLSIEPEPTYFVGPGVLVHNTPPPMPKTRHYVWRDAQGAVVSGGPFKIYLGTNATAPEWDDCMYVGQTEQTREKRQADHRAEAERELPGLANRPDDDRDKRYYRFKKDIVLAVIADGLLNKDQASWLEQGNIDYERPRRHEVKNMMNRREELVSTGPAVEARLRADPIVRASGYCP